MKQKLVGNSVIDIGYAGESYATQLVFNIPSKWDADSTKIKLLFKKPEATLAQEHNVSVVNGLVYWVVPSDCAIEGWGEIQLVYTDTANDTLIDKSKIYHTVCKKALEKQQPSITHKKEKGI